MPIALQEIGGDPAFIQKDEASRVERRGSRRPLRAGGRDVGAIVFGRPFFFTVKPSCFTARQMTHERELAERMEQSIKQLRTKTLQAELPRKSAIA